MICQQLREPRRRKMMCNRQRLDSRHRTMTGLQRREPRRCKMICYQSREPCRCTMNVHQRQESHRRKMIRRQRRETWNCPMVHRQGRKTRCCTIIPPSHSTLIGTLLMRCCRMSRREPRSYTMIHCRSTPGSRRGRLQQRRDPRNCMMILYGSGSKIFTLTWGRPRLRTSTRKC